MPAVPRPRPAVLAGDLRPAAKAPARTTAITAWQDAYAMVGTGRYADALSEMDPLTRGSAEVGSAAHRLRASVWRQLGLYSRAEDDGRRALELAAAVEQVDDRTDLLAAAAAGHVADAVGRLQSGDAAADAQLDERLAAARNHLAALDAGAPQRWRHVVRLAWVAGEVAITRGDLAQANDAFSSARAAADRAGAPRHEAKSGLFLAAVAAACRDAVAADRLAGEAARTAERLRAWPLVWPALLVRAEVTSEVGPARALHRDAARLLQAQVADLPEGLRAEVVRHHPCRWLLQLHPAEPGPVA